MGFTVEFVATHELAQADAASAALEGAAEFGWSKRHATGDKSPGPIKTGMGASINTWGGGGRGPSPAHCEIASDGSVIMRLGTQDLAIVELSKGEWIKAGPVH